MRMSVLQTFWNLGKLTKCRRPLKLITYSACKCISTRKSSDFFKYVVSFDDIVERRRGEAKRSILVQVNSEKSFGELYGYCSKYAQIKGMHHYKNSADEHFILVEFNTEENLQNVLQACSSHQKNHDVMASQSPFLWFRASSDKTHRYHSEGQTLETVNADMVVNEELLYESLRKCDTVSEQILMLYDRTALNDLGVRLRYLVARQVESLFESMYSNIAVLPFGSTVNGFGKLGCDLDLVLTNIVTDEMSDPSRRLVFQEKQCSGGLRPWARHMELVGAGLELRAPGAGRVLRVPHARVPIVQCRHQYADLDVDLCYNNMSGVHMSELLWSLGSRDRRVRPLVFAVRRWAQTVGLTNPNPGRWITNFPLTLMVLFFLQQRTTEGFILPPLNTLVQSADMRTAEDKVDSTFVLSPPSQPPPHSQSSTELQPALLQFFEFYAQFDFQDKAISILEGCAVRKPSSQPLYIVNPLEPELNVSKNVSYEECERLKVEVRNAAWQLEGCETKKGEEGWGVLALVERRTRSLSRLLRAGSAHRLLSVKDLFQDEDATTEVEGLKDKLKRLTPKTDKPTVKQPKSPDSASKKEPKLKNTQVASEVFRIRRNKIL